MDRFMAIFKVCTRPFKTKFQLNFTSLNTLVFVYLTARFLIDGTEEFLIQPTAWEYTKYLGESNMFLGLILAAYSTGTLVFAPFIGMLEVRFKGATKGIVLMGSLVKFIGNVLYSIPVNGYFPLFGRFLSGVGEGTLGVLYGAVTQCTTDSNRAKAFLYFEGLFAVGSISGPTIGSFLAFHVNILGWQINPGNSPGVVLTIAWFFLLTLTVFLPRDLAQNKEQVEEATSDENIDDETTVPKSVDESNSCCPQSTVFCLYYVLFLLVFIYSLTSFYTPLLAVHNIGLNHDHVELIYVNSSLFVFALFIATYLFSHKISEKIFGLILFVSVIVSISITCYFAVQWSSTMPINTAYLLLISIIIVSAMFVYFALSSSLISKITPMESAAFYQSLVFTVTHVALIFSRVIGGATFAKMPMIYTCLALTGAWTIGLIWLACEYKNLPPNT